MFDTVAVKVKVDEAAKAVECTGVQCRQFVVVEQKRAQMLQIGERSRREVEDLVEAHIPVIRKRC